MKMLISKIHNDFGMTSICESVGENILSAEVISFNERYGGFLEVYIMTDRSYGVIYADVVCCDDEGYPL